MCVCTAATSPLTTLSMSSRPRFFFLRGTVESIVDVTIAAPPLATRISHLSVLEEITLSDHQCIEFSLQERNQTVGKGRGGKEGASPRTQDDSAGTGFENTSKKSGSLMSLVRSGLQGRWKALCDGQGER